VQLASPAIVAPPHAVYEEQVASPRIFAYQHP
jgi:hypothetical protein